MQDAGQRRPPISPASKIRTLPNPIITECLRLMGAAATPLAFGEIYTALQAGVLDGLEHDPPTILASKFYETAKNYSLTAAQLLAAGDLLQRRDAQPHGPEAARAVPRAAAAKAAADTRAHGLAVEKEALDALKEKGVTIIECDKRAVPQARAAADRRIHQGAHPEAKPIIEIDPQHQGLTLVVSLRRRQPRRVLRRRAATGGARLAAAR